MKDDKTFLARRSTSRVLLAIYVYSEAGTVEDSKEMDKG